MIVEAKNKMEIHLNEKGEKSTVEFNGEKVGFIYKIEAGCDVGDHNVVRAKVYFVMPEVKVTAIDNQIEVFKVAGISVKEFSDVVKERDKYKVELEELKKSQK